jgi:hypothetical protein
MMMTEEAATAEVPQLKLPADLLAEVSRHIKAGKTDFRVDALKPSLMERLSRLFGRD